MHSSLRFVALVSSSLLAIACSAPGTQGAEEGDSQGLPLVGGHQVSAGEYSATVVLSGGCTAAKVGPRHLLLAAHCVFDSDTNTVLPAYGAGARIGVSKVSSGAAYRELTVAATHVFSTWTSACVAPCSVRVLGTTHPSDAAVIVVSEDTPDIPRAKVDNRKVATGDRVVMTGYGCENGLTSFSGGDSRLKIETTAALPSSALLHPGSYVTTSEDAADVAASYVVTAGRAKDSSSASLCFGDSGGPLYRADTQEQLVVGINAYYTFPDPYQGISHTNWHTRVDSESRHGVLAWLSGLGVDVRKDQVVKSDSVHLAPGTVQAEDFARTAEVGYHDSDSVNLGGQYRSEGVDIEVCKDEGGGFNVGWASPGEWLSYDVRAEKTAAYALSLRVAAVASGKRLHVDVDGVTVASGVDVPNTAGWQSWRTLEVPHVRLTEGKHAVRVVFDTDGINLNWLRFVAPVVVTTSGSPCAGLCESPVGISSAGFASGNLGIGATCHEAKMAIQGASCGNFTSPRSFSVNGAAVACDRGNLTLPAPRNGGYCFQASKGDPAWSWFSTW